VAVVADHHIRAGVDQAAPEPRRDVSTSGSGVFFSRRFNEVGDRITDNIRETLRAWVGARGEIGDTWTWEISGGYGEYNQE